MNQRRESEANWAIEIEREGNLQSEFYAVDSILIDDVVLRIQIAGGTTIDLKRRGIRRVLIMKTTPKVAIPNFKGTK